MENLLFGLFAWAVNLLAMFLVIRFAIDKSELTGQVAELIAEVRTLRRELEKGRMSVIDKRV